MQLTTWASVGLTGVEKAYNGESSPLGWPKSQQGDFFPATENSDVCMNLTPKSCSILSIRFPDFPSGRSVAIKGPTAKNAKSKIVLTPTVYHRELIRSQNGLNSAVFTTKNTSMMSSHFDFSSSLKSLLISLRISSFERSLVPLIRSAILSASSS